MKRRFRDAIAFASDERLVERPAPGAAPTAHRIWAAGENMTDHGPIYFTAQSAELLMTEQAKRGNLYSYDFDHLSLATDRPAEAGRAAGWHRLAARPDENGALELWAVDIEWCADVKAGLEEQPPKWRYFSPAYETDPETGEVISYLNTAVCINPATWHNNQLARRATRGPMKRSAMLAALKHMAENSEDEKEKQHAAKLYESMGGDKALAASEHVENSEGDKKDDDAPPSTKPSKKPAGGDSDKKDKGDDCDDDKRKDTAAKDTKPAAPSKDTAPSRDVDLALRVANLEKEAQEREKGDLIARHANRFTDSTKKWAAKQSLSVVKDYLAHAPDLDHRAPPAPATTRGEGTSATPAIGAEDDKKLDKILGITRAPEKIGWAGFDEVEGVHRFDTATPAQMRAKRTAAKAARKEV